MPTPLLDRKAILARFDGLTLQAREALAAMPAEALDAGWTLQKGDRVFTILPRAAALRSFVFNHAIHHRGQLTVYLRLLEIPVPALYNPSADEM